MNDKDIYDNLDQKLKDFQQVCSYDWLGIFLIGSQNYNLAYEGSDVDARIIYFGARSELPRDRHYESGEHCEAMTIFTFYDNLMDYNHSQIEVLFSSYSIINPKYEKIWKKLLDKREEIVRANETKWLKSCRALLDIHKIRFERNETEQLDLLERCGYAPKLVYLMVRTEWQLANYSLNLPYEQVLKYMPKTYLVAIKKGFYSRPEAEFILLTSYKRALAQFEKIKPAKTNFQTEHLVFKIVQELLNLNGAHKQ